MTDNTRERPSNYGLTHNDWRKGQWEATQTLLKKPVGSVIFLQAPVGSGKTAYARALAERLGATACMKTKALQEQYRELYDFDMLFGRGNYPCVHNGRAYVEASAAECLYELQMDKCEVADKCPYLIQKAITQQSHKRALNYAYMLTSRWVKDKKWSTGYLVLDEAHILPDEVLEFVSCTVKESERVKWRLADFPSCYDSSKESFDACLKWLEDTTERLELHVHTLKGEENKPRKAQAERMQMKLEQTLIAMSNASDDWHIRSGRQAIARSDGTKSAGMFIKPLTARHHFPRLFLGVYPRVMMMSATLGNVQDLAEELGIEHYDFEQVQNQWLPETRPVHVLDCPTMGMSANETARDKQAEIIANALNQLPEDWSGIIHVTSWRQADDLVARLIKHKVDKQRLFVPDRGNTSNQLAQWNATKRSNGKRGMLVVTPTFNAGVDLGEERIAIVAKCPFPYCAPGTYEFERMNYDRKFYKWQTASDLEQRAGRTRRGRDIDYDDAFNVRGYVAIADGAFRKMGMQKSCSKDFVESLVEG